MVELKFDEKGLIPVVVQEYGSNEVLMVAYMNREALRKTLETGQAHYWSRSRKKLWYKGETSGNYQIVKEILYDCDEDTLLLKVQQIGNACHTGHHSCFFRKLQDGLEVSPSSTILHEIQQVIRQRIRELPEGSYVAKLVKSGEDRIWKKVAEESVETILAFKGHNRGAIIYETADLLFHLLVLLAYEGIDLSDIWQELGGRRWKKKQDYPSSST